MGAALLTGLSAAAAYFSGIPAARLAAQVQIETESQLAASCAQFVGTAFLDDPVLQDRLHLAQRGAHEAPGLVTSSATEAASSTAGVLAYVVVLYSTWPVMLVALFITAVPIALIQRRISRRALQVAVSTTASYRWRDYYAILFTDPTSARDMRLHGAGDLFVQRLRDHLSSALEAETRQKVRTAWGQITFTLVNALIAGGGASWVAMAVAARRISVGDLVLFTVAVVAVQAQIVSLIRLTGQVYVSLGVFGHYISFVRRAATCETAVPLPAVGPLQDAIEFRDVWFRYRDDRDWVLRGVSLKLQRGQKHALVGLNGAGKSTIIKLLLRFYDPDRGQILWDGIDVTTLDAEMLRRRLAAVLQDYVPYEMTALENITVGDLHYLGDLARARGAAADAGIRDDIERLPLGFGTILSTRRADAAGADGTTLSGGQWQRIALARAFMRTKTDLVVLDEPNAGLDPSAEWHLQQDLMRLGETRTCLLISHRLAVVRQADQIIVLDHGTVRETGTHDELMTGAGFYCGLFLLQATGYLDHIGIGT